MSLPRAFTIARIITRLNVGGPPIQAVLMTDEFRRRGYRSLLVTGKVPQNEGSMEHLAAEKGIAAIRVDSLSRRISWYRDLRALLTLGRVLRREKPDIVHTHTAKAGALGRLAAMLSGVPIRVHTFHGNVFSGYFSPRMTTLFLMVERFLARHTDRIVAISESQKRELTERYRIAPPKKVVVIPLGLDLDAFLEVKQGTGAIKGEISCDPVAPLIAWVGRFTAIKAPEVFLDCATLLSNSGARFVMVGGGELLDMSRRRIQQQQLAGSVALLGWRHDLATIYADSRIVVCTSTNEGTPVALLEAMASARAVVSTDVGGVRDLMVGPAVRVDEMELFQNGVLVGREPREIAQAVSYLLEHRELCEAMGRAGREWVRNRYSHHRLADDLESLYVSIALSKGMVVNQVSPESAICAVPGETAHVEQAISTL
jgi:glycosyltransferase involved in cell wall biosynthesis